MTPRRRPGSRSTRRARRHRAGRFAAAVAPLFEGAPRFLGRLAIARPFGSVDELFARAREIAHAMPLDEQIELIDAHPRLGAPPATVSAMSFVEQGYDREPSEPHAAEPTRPVAAELDRLNAAYEARFGFRYCVFVAGRSRAALLPEMAGRARRGPRRRDPPGARRRRRHRRATGMRRLTAQPRRHGVIELGANRYGKAAIRLVRVARGPTAHRRPRPDRRRSRSRATSTAAHTDGDNAQRHRHRHDEEHGLRVRQGPPRRLDRGATAGRSAEHFLASPQVDRATVNIREHHWRAIDVAGTPAPDAFVRGGEGDPRRDGRARPRRRASSRPASRTSIVMKTTRSAFSGFPRDRYTTLPETDDRLMATKLTAIWRYGSPDLDFDATFDAVRATLLEVFADHDSPSVQASIWIMARAILERTSEVDEVRMVLPNLHHWLVDLSPFGLENDREIYIADDRAARPDRGDRPPAARADMHDPAAASSRRGPPCPGCGPGS